MTLKEAKKELKQQPKLKERIKKEYVTGEGILIGETYIDISNKSLYKQGMYQANVLLSAEEGQQLTKELEELRQIQYKEQGEGTELAPLTSILEPYTTNDTNLKYKYILRTQVASQMIDGKDITKPFHIVVEEVETKMLNGYSFSLKENSIVSLVVRFEAYTTTHTTGVLAVLEGLKVIKPAVWYKGKTVN